MYKDYMILLLLMESFLIFTFTSLDLLMFYVFFETVLIPIFLIIGIWGPRRRRIRASLLLFFYTLFGSILMLFAILVINLQVGSLDYQVLFLCNFTETKQKFLWLCFFLSFSAKIPMMPFHIWLPEAHVEAPTSGSPSRVARRSAQPASCRGGAGAPGRCAHTTGGKYFGSQARACN